jgi:hypothetical protein
MGYLLGADLLKAVIPIAGKHPSRESIKGKLSQRLPEEKVQPVGFLDAALLLGCDGVPVAFKQVTKRDLAANRNFIRVVGKIEFTLDLLGPR